MVVLEMILILHILFILQKYKQSCKVVTRHVRLRVEIIALYLTSKITIVLQISVAEWAG